MAISNSQESILLKVLTGSKSSCACCGIVLLRARRWLLGFVASLDLFFQCFAVLESFTWPQENKVINKFKNASLKTLCNLIVV